MRGDVVVLGDVEKAVGQIEGTIGGMIRAPMILDVSPLFSSDTQPG